MKRPTKSLLVAPLAIALIALAGCGKSDSGSGGAAGAAVTGKAAPAGKIWAEQVVATPEGGFRMGNPDAPIKLIEFGSYTCSHCRDFSVESHDPLERDYVNTGKVSFEYRNFIRDPIDMAIALIARCGGAEPFFPLSKQLFEHQEDLFKKIQSLGQPALDAALASPPDQRFVMVAQLTGLIEFAMQRGLPEAKARQCLADSKAVEALAEGVRKSTSEFNIEGTPTLILNGSKLDNVASWPLLVERLKAAGA
jgi:protein-disulfide isomerase